MSKKKSSFKIIIILFTVLAVLGGIIFLSMYFISTQNQKLFLEFTQNFQNVSMPIVTCISVVLLYHSIKDNTHQTKIARIDELISGHLDNLEKFMSQKITDIPYVVKYALSDNGDKGELEVDWDIKRLIIQVNAYLSIVSHVSLPKTKAVVVDYLNSGCVVCGSVLSSELQVEMEDLVSLLSQRNKLESDANKNLYVWKKMNGISPVLNYLDMLDQNTIKALSALQFSASKDDYFDCKQPVYEHAQTVSDYIDRVSKYEVLDVSNMKELFTEEQVNDAVVKHVEELANNTSK